MKAAYALRICFNTFDISTCCKGLWFKCDGIHERKTPLSMLMNVISLYKTFSSTSHHDCLHFSTLGSEVVTSAIIIL